MKLKVVKEMKVGALAEGCRIAFADSLGVGRRPVGSNEAHLRAAIEWIARAQDASPDDGVSRGYSVLGRKWGPSYPETTGYIIPTFFDYFHATGDDESRQRALRMADWEISGQMDNGAVQSGDLDLFPRKPAVFNTGQVLFGLVRAYKETKEDKYKKAAEKAADWLVEAQDNDGSWRTGLSALTTNPVHVYNTRTAWGLLEAYTITLKETYLKSAVDNIDWALTQQLDNGWFTNNAFDISETPLLHTIAYAIRGVLECGANLDKKLYISAAAKSADALLELQQEDGSLYGKYDSNWKNTVKWSCLTGDAQVSVIWLRLFELTRDIKYLDATMRMNCFLKRTQDLRALNKNIRGGIKGSQPIWGGYGAFSYLSWATKFFVDALLLEDKIETEQRG